MPQDVFVQLSEKLPLGRWLRHGVLVAVSGGADSMALFRFFVQFLDEKEENFGNLFKHKLGVGHVNHRLRGEESDVDALFVRNLTKQFGFDYFEHEISHDEWVKDESGSREAAARRIRYDFLSQTAKRLGFRYVATAHTADDQAETVLHRITRGTGIVGLAGIRPFRQLDPAITLIRPFLKIRRHEILDYLEHLNQVFRTDSSNHENDYTRNRIRNIILPLLRRYLNPKVDDSIRRLADLAGETEETLDDFFNYVFEKIVFEDSMNSIVLNIVELQLLRPATIREIFVRIWRRKSWPLRKMGFEDWTNLTDFVFSNEKHHYCYGKIIIEKRNNRLMIRQGEEDREA